MTITRPAALLLFALAVSACKPSPQPNEAPQVPPPVKDTALGDMVGTMDKARSVEATTMEHKEALDKSVQEAEGH